MIPAFMVKLFGANWRTSASGLVVGISTFVIFGSQSFHLNFPAWALALAAFTTAGGTVTGLLAAKDARVTGGDIQQAGLVPVAPVPPVPLVQVPEQGLILKPLPGTEAVAIAPLATQPVVPESDTLPIPESKIVIPARPWAKAFNPVKKT